MTNPEDYDVLTYEPQSKFTNDLYQAVQSIAKDHNKKPRDAFVQLVGLFRQMYGLDATQGCMIFKDKQ